MADWIGRGESPPRLLAGDHRACGVYRPVRDGADASLTLHLGVGS